MKELLGDNISLLCFEVPSYYGHNSPQPKSTDPNYCYLGPVSHQLHELQDSFLLHDLCGYKEM